MTATEELLKLSLIYRTLINDIEEVAGVSFPSTAKHQMTELVNSAVGQALAVYTLRCAECDKPIDPICDECV